MLHAEYFQKILCEVEINILQVLGRFCMRALWKGLNKKCQSFAHDLNFWPALHTPQQFSPIAHAAWDRLFPMIKKTFDR
jgi:hypothetical protein